MESSSSRPGKPDILSAVLTWTQYLSGFKHKAPGTHVLKVLWQFKPIPQYLALVSNKK